MVCLGFSEAKISWNIDKPVLCVQSDVTPNLFQANTPVVLESVRAAFETQRSAAERGVTLSQCMSVCDVASLKLESAVEHFATHQTQQQECIKVRGICQALTTSMHTTRLMGSHDILRGAEIHLTDESLHVKIKLTSGLVRLNY